MNNIYKRNAKNMKRIITAVVFSIFFLWGCTWFEPKEENSAYELAVSGMDYFKKGRFELAREAFEKIKDWYPFSKYAILAELKIADSHFARKEYEEAVFAYEEFENLHPRNESIPYVVYKIGRSYFDQIDSPDRDQTSAQKALDTFTRLIKQYPESPYADRAEGHIRECWKSLAEAEFRIGYHYFKSKRYKAARDRFKSIPLNYPDVGVHRKALKYFSLSQAFLDK